MHDLAAFQQTFADLLDRHPERPDPMDIYRNTVRLGAVDALADNFPVVRELVGDEAFGMLANEFASIHPPESPILALYGASFDGWLDLQPIPFELGYLPDVARCERLWLESLFAENRPALTLNDLAGANLASLQLSLHPAARFGWFATPAPVIWQTHRDGSPGLADMAWQGTGALFTRPEDCVVRHDLTLSGHLLLGLLRDGEPLGDAAMAVLARNQECDVGALFASLVTSGAFAASAPEGA